MKEDFNIQRDNLHEHITDKVKGEGRRNPMWRCVRVCQTVIRARSKVNIENRTGQLKALRETLQTVQEKKVHREREREEITFDRLFVCVSLIW